MNIEFVVGATAAFCDPASQQQVQAFFRANKVPTAERTLAQSLERIGYCIDLKAQQQPKLAAWLERHGRPQAGD